MAIDGVVKAGFEAVRSAFEENFATRGEVGAACAVVVDNELVVDLWGGQADPKNDRAWASDTIVNVFSTTKGHMFDDPRGIALRRAVVDCL